MPPLRLSVCIIEFCAIADAGVVWRTERFVSTLLPVTDDAAHRSPWPAVDISDNFELQWAGYVETALSGSWTRTRDEERPQELPCMN